MMPISRESSMPWPFGPRAGSDLNPPSIASVPHSSHVSTEPSSREACTRPYGSSGELLGGPAPHLSGVTDSKTEHTRRHPGAKG